MNPATRALNGENVWLGRLLIAAVPVLLTAVGVIGAWVIEIRASRYYTAEDHAEHMRIHAEETVSQEVLRELERINTRLAVVEEHLVRGGK
jgi:hypothetical protein